MVVAWAASASKSGVAEPQPEQTVTTWWC